MNYTSLLSDADMKILCKIVSEKEIRKLFQNHPKDFSKMKPGFRPNALSDEEVVSITIRNLKRPFLNTFFNTYIRLALERISSEKEKLKAKGYSEEYALAEAIFYSEFCSDPYLYFKLNGEEVDEELLEAIKNWVPEDDEDEIEEDMSEVADVSEQTQNMLATIDLLNLEVQELQTKLEESVNEKNASDKIHSSEMTTLLERNETLKKSLDETIHKLQLIQREKQKADAELLDLRARANYDDTETVEKANLSEYQYVSLCVVSVPDFKNIRWLFRIADINRRGQIEAFYADEDKPKSFANRERLFWRDGPSEEGTVGIWNWNAITYICLFS